MPKSSLNWFEIPADDLERAVKFYSAILDEDIPIVDVDGQRYGFLPVEQGGIGGGITKHEDYTPSDKGTTVFLNGGNDLQVVLDRIEGAGGTIVAHKSDIGNNGFFAMFIDTEGNRVGLHSMG